MDIGETTVVRAYDLGGFGDVAGAMRVASHLKKIGTEVLIEPKSDSTRAKLKILSPDVPVSVNGEGKKGVLQVDVAGHYRDDRNSPNNDVPHLYTEDMDNPRNRRTAAPVYLKSGIRRHVPQVSASFQLGSFAPMFYRPFREWELPKPGERDARRQLIDLVFSRPFLSAKSWWNQGKLGKVVEKASDIGFAHLSPEIQAYPAEAILEHPYFYAVHSAHLKTGRKFAVGMFVGKDLEKKLTEAALNKHWGVVSSSRVVEKHDPDVPTVIFLGPQPQTTVTGLFLSSDIPNLVTGDLSLSDALYALIAQQGHGFFYETPGWKVPTHVELFNILLKSDPTSALDYLMGSNFMPNSWIDPKWIKENKHLIKTGQERVVELLCSREEAAKYTENMRKSLRAEIKRRFGDVPVEPQGKGDFSIPPGAPYLIQDAAAQVVEVLRENADALAETENVRSMIKDGVPVRVNVSTGVLEPAPAPAYKPFSKSIFDDSYIGILDKYLIKKSSGLLEYNNEGKNNYYGNSSLESTIYNKSNNKNSISYFDDLDDLYGLHKKPKKIGKYLKTF